MRGPMLVTLYEGGQRRMPKLVIQEGGWHGKHITELRDLLGWSQAQLARELDLPSNQVSHHEKDRDKALPSVWRALLTQFCSLRNVEIVFEGSSPPSVENGLDEEGVLNLRNGDVAKPSGIVSISKQSESASTHTFDVRLGEQEILGPQLSRWLSAHHGVDHLYIVDCLNNGIPFADEASMSVADSAWFEAELEKLAEFSGVIELLHNKNLAEAAEPVETVHVKTSQAHRMIAGVDDDAQILLVAVSQIKGAHYNYYHSQIEKDMRTWRKRLRGIFQEKSGS